MTEKECILEAEVLVDLDHGSTPFGIFQMVTGRNELLEIIVTETNRYATQNGRNFETTEDKMKAFLGKNFLWASISYLWKTIGQQTNVSEMKRFKMS